MLRWAVDTVAAAVWKACTSLSSWLLAVSLDRLRLLASGLDRVGTDTPVRPSPARKSGAFCCCVGLPVSDKMRTLRRSPRS